MFRRWENGEPTSIVQDLVQSLKIGLPMHALTTAVIACGIATFAQSAELSATHPAILFGLGCGTILTTQTVVTGATLLTREKSNAPEQELAQ